MKRPAKLRDVVRKCLREKKFFDSLLRNPESTLRKAKMQLSPDEMRKLKKHLRKRSTVQQMYFFYMMGEISKAAPPWEWGDPD